MFKATGEAGFAMHGFDSTDICSHAEYLTVSQELLTSECFFHQRLREVVLYQAMLADRDVVCLRHLDAVRLHLISLGLCERQSRMQHKGN